MLRSMDAVGYLGSDGKRYRNPCTSQRGKPKERWPSEKTAWFVVELVARGEHRARGVKATMYPYRCPRCEGWHLASCRTEEQHEMHRAGIARLLEERAASPSTRKENVATCTEKGPP